MYYAIGVPGFPVRFYKLAMSAPAVGEGWVAVPVIELRIGAWISADGGSVYLP